MRTRLSLPTTLLALSASASILGCGDNLTPGGGGNPDAPPVDAPLPTDAPNIDASTAPTVGGTLAVFDAILVDPSATAAPPTGAGGVRGGTIRISFNDFTMGGGVQTSFGSGAIGGCVITRFDATHPPNPRLDAGAITISGPATGDNALVKTVGPCTLQAALGDPDPYACISHASAGATATVTAVDANAIAAGAGLVVYQLPSTANFGTTAAATVALATRNAAGTAVTVNTVGPHGITVAGQAATWVTITGRTPASFDTTTSPFGGAAPVVQVVDADTFVYGQMGTPDEVATLFGTATATTNRMIGSALVVNGLPNTAFNSGASAFPIVGQVNDDALLVRNTAPADNANTTATTVGFTVLNGFSPIPGSGDGRANFLNGSPAPNTASSIRIQKASNAVWPAIDVTIDVPGEARRPVSALFTRNTNVATGTTTVDHEFLVGQVINVDGGTDNSFDATGVAITAVTARTFQFTSNGSDVAVGVDGTAVKPGSFALDGTSASLTAFPTTGTATAQKYSCNNNTAGAADDTCGDESTAILKAFIISGSATKKSVAGLFPFQMPTEVPGSADAWLEWQCAALGAKAHTMPVEAVQMIIDFQPTRIEQQVLFVGGTLLDGPGANNAGTLRVLAGHALAGHTDRP